jgi:hypothetical protein
MTTPLPHFELSAMATDTVWLYVGKRRMGMQVQMSLLESTPPPLDQDTYARHLSDRREGD